MKTKFTLALLSVFLTVAVSAQRKASVYAANSDISDNLDLKAVASIFGDSKDLADFEYKLNDPNLQISNLDLNNDNMVDYLRVIEMVENNTHLVVLQSVLQEDVYQDVATIAVSKKKNRQVNIQIIGDPYMYGSNYIYEPVYVVRPPLYNNFWVNNYRPYRSYYGWNRYPTFYTSWSPYAYGHYHQNVYAHINHNNYYNYCSNIYNPHANNYYRKYRNNGYEQKYPHRDFKHRTSQVNKYDYDRIQGRSPQVATGSRPSSTYQDASRSNATTRSLTNAAPTKSASVRPTSKAIAPSSSINTRPTNTVNIRANSNAVNPTTRPRNITPTRENSNSIRPATVTTTRSTIGSSRNVSNSVKPVSAQTSRPATSSNTRPTQTQSNNRERTATNSASSRQRSSPTVQRPSANSQNSGQRSSNVSTKSPQKYSGGRNSESNRSFR